MFPKSSDEIFYFADLCSGPGGFSEYVLWRRENAGHGFGFTLKGKDDFRLDKFLAACPEMFEPFYGIDGTEGDGDITNPENLRRFHEFVNKVTDGKGVNMVMADGRIPGTRGHKLQEILSKRMYLCQACCAFSILTTGGNFVFKVFDTFTPFSVGLLYLLWRCFNQICIHKPRTSRPASSERYIICLGYRDSDVIWRYLFNVNERFDEISKLEPKQDVIELVPLDLLHAETDFIKYVTEINERFAERQTYYLEKYKAFARNLTLHDSRQEEMRKQCLSYWRIPDLPRPELCRSGASSRFAELCKSNTNWIRFLPPAFVLDDSDMLHFNMCACSGQLQVVISLGKGRVYVYDDGRWADLRSHSHSHCRVRLPKDTLLLVDLTYEYSDVVDDKKKSPVRNPIFRIIDAYYLCGKDISGCTYNERMRLSTKFCKTISKEHSRPDLAIVRTAQVWKFEELHKVLKRYE
ncbi:unnamed protein product [Soboliphyme baturini]|uniref:Cap-specific mRNA (nucleoside-2'-O-)-methyltransferase 1 n=1 Tax=Soboliphyme baturini TaxID=241478 RepID=A0A183IZ14_9BILA|nr:unnamed protein product [Soboliphyme baturini]